MKKFVLGGILALIVVAAFLTYRLRQEPEEGVLAVSGNVEATEINIGFKYAGRVVELMVEEGESVRQGDTLAVMDSAELQSLAAQSRAYLDETRSRLLELKAGARPQELERAKAEVSRAEAELDKARKDFERAEVLFRNGAIAAQQMDALKKSFEVARSLHKNAVETLSLVKEGPRKEEVAAAENRVRQAEAALNAAEERLKDTVIRASLPGMVLRRNVEPGEMVAAGIPVYTIGDLDRPWIKVYVKEDKLGLVKLGQKAEISTDSYPGKIYKGAVTFISSEAEFTPKNVQTQEERVKLVFGVKVSAENENGELKPGMPADVKIILK